MSCKRFCHTFKATVDLSAPFRITKHSHSHERMTTVWLLPAISLIVPSSVGAELALSLHASSPTIALTTIAFTIFIVSIGLVLAFIILAIYFDRLILHGFPQGSTIVSSFIPLGPFGQAGFCVLTIGKFMKEALPVAGSTSPFLGSAQAGEVVYALCVCIGFILWAIATMWLVYGLLGMQYILRRTRISFELSFWGMIFPNVSRGRFCNGLRDVTVLLTGCIRHLNRRPLRSPRCHIFPCLGRNLFSVHHPIVVFNSLSDSRVGSQWEDF
jgi:tellurite resistance protein TehA-like permease